MSNRTIYRIVADGRELTPGELRRMEFLMRTYLNNEWPIAYNNAPSALYWARVINDILLQDGGGIHVIVQSGPEYPPVTAEQLDRKARNLFP